VAYVVAIFLIAAGMFLVGLLMLATDMP